MGELRAHLARFDLPGIRKTARELKDLIGPHTLKEESVLYLIGARYLQADNKKLPQLFKEHHQTADRLNILLGLLFSGRMTDTEDQIQQLTFVILEALDEHMTDEETVVYPALERLIDEQTKNLILSRYASVEGDDFDEFDRTPLLSMPDMSDNSGVSSGAGAPPTL
jgi:hemerythrin-like domain-containing protein